MFDSIKPYTMLPRARVASNAPHQSRLRGASSSRLSGTCQKRRTSTAAASGMLIKKTQRQEAYCTNQPPNTGPTAAVIAVKPDHVPMAFPRCLASKDALMMARLPGTRRAPPIPWTARAIISEVVLGESPHHTEATAKITTPMAKMRRLP